jgi:hypothetical protein
MSATTAVNQLPKFATDYIGQIFVPGYAKLLAAKPWFADACARGLECPECPKWLGQWLCAEGLDRAKIFALLRVPAMHRKVVEMLYHFSNQLDMTMVNATDAEWGDAFGETYDPESSAKIIGIVRDGQISEMLTLYRDPTDAIEAIEHFVDYDLRTKGESIHPLP